MINCGNCLKYHECEEYVTPDETFPETGFCPAFRAKEICDIEDTVSLMTSEDYKERFKAEYWQTKIRYERLKRIIARAEAGTLDFELSCPLKILAGQADAMREYLWWLEVRAEIEGVDL